MNKLMALPLLFLFFLFIIPQNVEASPYLLLNTNVSTPTNGTQYIPFGNITFEVRIALDQGSTNYFIVNNATFEINGTNYTKWGSGYQIYNDTSGYWWLNLSRHLLSGAGPYNIRWYSQHVNGSWNVSQQITYFIAVNNTNPVRYYVNGNSNVSSTTGTSSEIFNVTGLLEFTTLGNTNSGSLNMFRGVTDVTSEIGSKGTIPVGTWYYLINTSGNNNYTVNRSGIDFTIIINPIGGPGGGGTITPTLPVIPSIKPITSTRPSIIDQIKNWFANFRLPRLTALQNVPVPQNNINIRQMIVDFFSFRWVRR